MKTLFAALAAVVLSALLWSQPAEARCWWNGWRWHCTHHWRHHYWHSRYYYRSYGYYYRPYYYYRPWVCVPFTPFCA